MRRLVVVFVAALAIPAGSAAARGPLAELRAARSPVAQLTPLGSVTLGETTIYRYQQRVGGIDVLAAEAIVADTAGARPELVADTTAPAVASPLAPRVSHAAAVGVALAGIRRLEGRPSARLVLTRGQGGTLAWEVSVPSLRPLADLQVLVDARSGAVLVRRDLLKDFRTGDAKLYDPNPVVMNGGSDQGLHDAGDANSPLLSSLRTRVALKRLRGGQSCLRGSWAHAVSGPAEEEVCLGSLDWRSVRRSNDIFEALEAYYQVTRAETYIQSLGFSDANHNGINDHSILLRADAITDDNSFFRPSRDDLTFGTGGVDDAEDADVIWHEYGHAMQDDQVPGFGHGAQAGAQGEGFGDYWSAAMTAETAGTNATDAQCVFDWDGLLWGDFQPSLGRICGRRTNDSRTYQQVQLNLVCRSDIHCVGQIWSSALWDLRKALGDDGSGRSIMDRVVLASHFRLGQGAKFAAAANALQAADEDLYPAGAAGDGHGAHYSQIHSEMTGRGFL